MKNVNVNLRLLHEENYTMKSINDNIVPTGITINGRSYYELKQFAAMHPKHSDSQIRRKLKLVENVNCDQYYYRFWNKIFVSDAILNLNADTFKKTNGIKGNWVMFLSGFKWDYFGCIRYKSNLQLLTVKQRLSCYFNKLSAKYRGKEVRLFYTIEKNPRSEGYHFHFILFVDTENKSELKSFTENYFRGTGSAESTNSTIVKYKPEEGGIAYILKQIHLNPDGLDFLTKNDSLQK